jgi:hypothetical protein
MSGVMISSLARFPKSQQDHGCLAAIHKLDMPPRFFMISISPRILSQLILNLKTIARTLKTLHLKDLLLLFHLIQINRNGTKESNLYYTGKEAYCRSISPHI